MVSSGQITEHCQANVVLFHQILVPAILTGLEDPKDTVVLSTCYVVENFVDALQQATLITYMPHLLQRLVHILQNCPNKDVQELSLSAIAATAVSAEIQFLPYAEVIKTIFVVL
jgi:hypothetical protein